MTTEKLTPQPLLIDPSTDSRWDSFILSHPQGCLYHHSLWKEVIQASFGYRPLYLICENHNNSITAAGAFFLVKSAITGSRIVSLPFSDHCDILADTPDDLSALLSAAREKASQLKASFIELKIKNDRLLHENSYDSSCFFSNYLLSLEKPLDEIYGQFHRSCIRQCIQKALKSDITVLSTNTEKDLILFYTMHTITRKRQGLPPLPFVFFKNMRQFLSRDNLFHVLTAFHHEKPIAGLLLAHYKNGMYALYNASLKEYRHLHPNHLLFWKAIEYSKEHNFSFFDFGRTSDHHNSLIEFKKRCGCIPCTIRHFYFGKVIKKKVLANRGWVKYAAASTAMKAMPQPLLRLISNTLYRHLG
ncbi:MAG: GNAT family N-acetyltransferase [Chitinivibrionales bacterium]|nr:GNAT family N-acetyltransferase [Chitinivibrionales bacterium]